MGSPLTANTAEWIDSSESVPPNGSKVLGLTHGNKLIEIVWSEEAAKICDAWSYYLKVPQKVKERQAARFKFN